MINPVIVDILLKRISEGGINPKTREPMKLEDITPVYQEAVENEILIKTRVL